MVKSMREYARTAMEAAIQTTPHPDDALGAYSGNHSLLYLRHYFTENEWRRYTRKGYANKFSDSYCSSQPYFADPNPYALSHSDALTDPHSNRNLAAHCDLYIGTHRYSGAHRYTFADRYSGTAYPNA